MSRTGPIVDNADAIRRPDREALYRRIAAEMAPAFGRLAAGFEADPQAREDLVQEMHLRIWCSLARFDGCGDLKAWAYRVAHNTAADHVRQAVRRKATLLSDAGDLEAVESRPGPAAQAEVQDDAERLMTLIRNLPVAERHVIVLYLEGETPKSIAELTGLTPGAVSVRVHRTRAALARGMKRREEA